MLKIHKEAREGSLWVKLVGDIDETADFDQIAPINELKASAPQEIVCACKEVRRINSSGVKAWIKYFQAVKGLGIPMRFLELSVPLVEQVNQISNFIAGGKIESIYVPFSCPACRTDLVGLFSTQLLQKPGFKLPTLKCAKCQGPAQFDDIEEEYLAFLKR